MFVFIYLFIYLLLNASWREKLVIQWAKNLSNWVTSFREWVTFVSLQM